MINVQKFADAVNEILNYDRDHTWSETLLAAKVGRLCDQKNMAPIRTTIKAMVASGVVDGYLSRSGRSESARHITWKEPTVRDDETSRRDREAHERQVGVARQATADAEAALALALIETAEAKKQAAETKAMERVVEIRVKSGKKTVRKMKSLFHSEFEKILKLAQARMNVFIYGPTGCGKSHICSQIAEALGLSFAFVSCTGGMSEGVLGGRLLPVGDQGAFEYVISEFIKAYEEGGVFLLDEIDAADPNVLLLVNAALANGHVAVPNRPEAPYAKRHPDFICIAAANTVGTGADRCYSGRNKLDAATLDRFQIGKVLMGYDGRVETILCPDDELRGRLTKYREAINAHRLERAMSTRFMRDSHKMMHPEAYDETYEAFTMADIDTAFFAGWREDEVGKVRSHAGV